MYVDAQTILTVVEVATGVIAIGGILFAIFRWFEKQKKQDADIASIKEEQCMLSYGVLACLKGLKEQGCNGPVTEAIDKFEKYLNKKAHDQE